MENKTAFYTVAKQSIGGKLVSMVFFEYEPGKFAQDNRFFCFNPKKAHYVSSLYDNYVKVRDFIFDKAVGAYVPISL